MKSKMFEKSRSRDHRSCDTLRSAIHNHYKLRKVVKTVKDFKMLNTSLIVETLVTSISKWSRFEEDLLTITFTCKKLIILKSRKGRKKLNTSIDVLQELNILMFQWFL